MPFRTLNQSNSKVHSFNMTPIIDIVFLLIIFFMVVCQFIEAENFPVNVPEGCEFAQSDTEPGSQITTVSVMKTTEDKVEFAVGSEKITQSSRAGIVEKLAQLIDIRLRELPPEGKVITLRIDKDIRFAHAQYALAGVAASSATDIRLATLRDKRPDKN